MRAVNLIPVEQRSSSTAAPGQSQGAVYVVLVAMAGLALLVFLYGSARHQVSSKRGEAASLTGQAQSVEAEANRLAPYADFVSLHNERVKALAQLVGTRFDWAHSFRELGRVLPADVSLSSVQGTIGGSGPGSSGSSASSAPSTPSAAPAAPAAPAASGTAAGSTAVSSATPPGSVPTMTLAGCTTSQSEVAVTLERLRLIDGVTDVELQNSTKPSSSGGSSSGSTTSSGPCPVGGATFSAQISFTALPPAPTGGTYGNPTVQVASTAAFEQSGSVGGRRSQTTKSSIATGVNHAGMAHAKRVSHGPAAAMSTHKRKGSR